MIYWVKADMYHGPVEGIEIPGVMAIVKTGDHIDFFEMCDEVNRVRMTKEEAIAALREAIVYIEGG